MKERGRFLYKDDNGTIFIKFEHPGKGVPIESLLPENGRGAGFADFRITDYFNLADLVLAAPQDWKKFGQNANVQGVAKDKPAKLMLPPPNMDFLNLRTGDVSKACWFLLCSDASVGYGEAFKTQGDPPCPVLIRPNSAACSPA